MSGARKSPDDSARAQTAPTPAERCRTLLAAARNAMLSTLARNPAGYPYGSLIAIAPDGAGRPLMLLSSLAEHTANLSAHPEASVLVAEPAAPGADPLALGRVTLIGPCRAVEPAEADAARAAFLAAHPGAAQVAGFKDFSFHRLEPLAIRWIGGFGRMTWIDPEAYNRAEPDPIAPAAAGILAHMNGDHAEAVLAYARALAGIDGATAAQMTAVNRYGFELRAKTPDGPRAARLVFDAPVATTDDVRKAMVALVKAARARLG